MDGLGSAFFIPLNGTPPSHLHLEPLSTFEPTRKAVELAFSPFLSEPCAVQVIEDLSRVESNHGRNPRLVYLMGHAWISDDDFCVAARLGGVDQVLNSQQLLNLIAPALRHGGLLIVDTCHAAALREKLALDSLPGLTVAFASGADEAALEFPADAATRFAITLGSVLHKFRKANHIDSVELVIAVKREINRAKPLVLQHGRILGSRVRR